MPTVVMTDAVLVIVLWISALVVFALALHPLFPVRADLRALVV